MESAAVSGLLKRFWGFFFFSFKCVGCSLQTAWTLPLSSRFRSYQHQTSLLYVRRKELQALQVGHVFPYDVQTATQAHWGWQKRNLTSGFLSIHFQKTSVCRSFSRLLTGRSFSINAQLTMKRNNIIQDESICAKKCRFLQDTHIYVFLRRVEGL